MEQQKCIHTQASSLSLDESSGAREEVSGKREERKKGVEERGLSPKWLGLLPFASGFWPSCALLFLLGWFGIQSESFGTLEAYILTQIVPVFYFLGVGCEFLRAFSAPFF